MPESISIRQGSGQLSRVLDGEPASWLRTEPDEDKTKTAAGT